MIVDVSIGVYTVTLVTVVVAVEADTVTNVDVVVANWVLVTV
jgi:hypothetical protein